MPAPGELIMIEPKRPKPPKHWSDWTVEERKAQVIELGLPGFRADQFSRQWYQRLNNDTASWTDVPAEMREVVKDLLFPDLMTSIRELKCDDGTTRAAESMVAGTLARYFSGDTAIRDRLGGRLRES
jgi:23S rRNA (adenine2503-C2)-methyltransferase